MRMIRVSASGKVMTTIRAFVAVQLTVEVAAVLSDTSQQLALSLPGGLVRWLKPEAIHLTLRFLGETKWAQLPALSAALDTAVRELPPFSLPLGCLGCFPNPRRPRVLWLGLQDQDRQLQQLKRAVDASLAPHGWEPERQAFQPHLTLGRVKGDGRAVAAAGLPWGQMVSSLPLPVTAIHLIESQLRATGSLYRLRHSSHLGR